MGRFSGLDVVRHHLRELVHLCKDLFIFLGAHTVGRPPPPRRYQEEHAPEGRVEPAYEARDVVEIADIVFSHGRIDLYRDALEGAVERLDAYRGVAAVFLDARLGPCLQRLDFAGKGVDARFDAGGRIARVAPSGSIDASGIRVLDGAGEYLVPGLIDLHAHIWDDASLLSWLHNGVTTVRDIASQRVKTADLRNIVEAGGREGPRIVYAGAMFHHGGGYSTLGNQMVSDAGDIARGVAINAGMGAAYTKERGFQGWERAATVVREAHRYGMPVSGHCGHILAVVAAGIDGAEHVLDCFRDRGTMRGDYVALARASGEWIVPTAALRLSMVRVMDDPALLQADDVAPFLQPQYRPVYGTDAAAQRGRPALLAAVQRLEAGVRRYHDAGVLVAAGTDSPFPLGVQHELEALVESGFSPAEALVAATGAAARVLNAPEIGTIAPGQWADLLLLSANPLDDIRHVRRIHEVIQGGRVIDRERLRRDGVR